jgi:hypothetical protein
MCCLSSSSAGLSGTLILSCSVGFALALSVRADETSAEIHALVESLASPNSPPKLVREGELGHLESVPKGYDLAAQDQIWQACEKLLSKGVAAFPELVVHVGDKRYSMTFSADWEEARHDNGYMNVSVGEICKDVILAQVYAAFPEHAIRDETAVARPSYWIFNPRDPASVAKWWRDRSGRTLVELQREGLQRAVDRERKRGFSDLREEAQVLGPLLYLLIKIDQSGSPLAPTPFRPAKRL